MPPRKKSILVEIFGKDKLSANLGKMTAKLNKFGKAAKNIGSTLSTRVSLPIVALGAISTKVFMGFDDSMRKVQAVTGATGAQFNEMTALAEEMGRTTRFTASQAAEGMTFLGMAGLSVDKVMQALPGTLQLAAAGGIELAEAADIATNVMSAMKLPVSDLGRINDVLAHTQANANTNILEMAEALEPVAGTARSLGLDLESLVAMIGQLANVGTKGSKAGRQLMNAFLEFSKKTGRPVTEFSQFIDELNQKNVSATEIMSKFGKVGGKAIVALMAEGGTKVRSFTKDLQNSQGAAAKTAATMEAGIGGTMRKVKSALEGVAITIGRALTPVLLKVAEFITRLTEKFQALSPRTQRIILIVLVLVAAIGPLLVIVGSLALVISVFAIKVVAIGIAIGVFIGFIVMLWKKWKDLSTVGKLLVSIIFPFPVMIMAMVKAVKLLVGWLDKMITKFKAWWNSPAATGLKTLMSGIKNAAGKILFKQPPAATNAANAAAITAAAGQQVLNRNTTQTSKIQIDVTGNPGTKVRADAGGNDLDVVNRGAAFAM